MQKNYNDKNYNVKNYNKSTVMLLYCVCVYMCKFSHIYIYLKKNSMV
jgi:hypothetical protein